MSMSSPSMHEELFSKLIGKHPDFTSELAKLEKQQAARKNQIATENQRFSALLAIPPSATLPCRLDQATMSDADKLAFKNAVQELVDNGQYKPLCLIHADMSHNMHGSMGLTGAMRFLAWHRRYLLEFQTLLLKADQALRPDSVSSLLVPYWRWQDSFPEWLKEFLPAKNPASQPVATENTGVPASLCRKTDGCRCEVHHRQFRHATPRRWCQFVCKVHVRSGRLGPAG